jgi:predicted transcriptional regulator
LAASAGDEGGIDERLPRLAAEPTRIKVLFVLNERTAGVGEVAEELKISESEAARHVEAMHEVGLIEVVGEVLRRGASGPRYRAAVPMLWSDEEWAELSLAEQRRLTAWIVRMINADVSDALEAGTFNARTDSHASRTVSMVDEQGWRELSQVHSDALESIVIVQAASAERLAESGENGTPVLSAMICCELPRRRTEPLA